MQYDHLTIRQILNRVESGQIRVPSFQRGFVWDPERVAFLMDSLYKGYPIGSLLIWRTKERLSSERQLGPYCLPEPEADFPVDYILDGQQRTTSIFGVFQTALQPDGDDAWAHIYFDSEAEADIQDSQFVSLTEEDVDEGRHFPLRALFDTVRYRRSTRNLSDDLVERIDRLQETFKEARVPVQMLETEEKASVAIVFERVNQRGVELDTLQLMSAWTWSNDFDLQEEFQNLSEEFEPFGFAGVGEDNNLMLRVTSAVLAGDASTKSLITLNGATVRSRFDEVRNGFKGAIDFLRSQLQVSQLRNLPYPNLLVPLGVFFADPGNRQLRMTDGQRRALERWFWTTCLSKRYNSQPARSMRADIAAAQGLRGGDEEAFDEVLDFTVSAEFFQNNKFRMNNVLTKSFILLLAQLKPRSFVSGNVVSIEPVLKSYNRSEFHHIYPRSYLNTLPTGTYDPSCLANMCFLSRSDNNSLGGDAPSVYRSKMPTDVREILEASLVDEATLVADDFDRFVVARSRALADYANSLLS